MHMTLLGNDLVTNARIDLWGGRFEKGLQLAIHKKDGMTITCRVARVEMHPDRGADRVVLEMGPERWWLHRAVSQLEDGRYEPWCVGCPEA
jgi:hypothetical protein